MVGDELRFNENQALLQSHSLAGHFTFGFYGSFPKNFCYTPISKFWQEFETQSQNMDMVCDLFALRTIGKLSIIVDLGIPSKY